MKENKENLYMFVMKKEGEVVGGQSQFLMETEVEKYVANYKRAYTANEVLVYTFDQSNNNINLAKELSLMEKEVCLNCKGTGYFMGIPGEPCPVC